MKLHNIAISVLIVSLIAIGAISYISSLSDNYSQNIDFTGLEKTQLALNNITNQTQEIQSTIDSMTLETGGNAFDIPYKMIQVGWQSIKLFTKSIFTIRVIVNEGVTVASENGGVDLSYLQASVVVVLTLLVVAMLVYAFFKWKFED